jgi:hypothetical protein
VRGGLCIVTITREHGRRLTLKGWPTIGLPAPKVWPPRRTSTRATAQSSRSRCARRWPAILISARHHWPPLGTQGGIGEVTGTRSRGDMQTNTVEWGTSQDRRRRRSRRGTSVARHRLAVLKSAVDTLDQLVARDLVPIAADAARAEEARDAIEHAARRATWIARCAREATSCAEMVALDERRRRLIARTVLVLAQLGADDTTWLPGLSGW